MTVTRGTARGKSKILNLISSLLVAVVVIAAAALVGVRLFGLSTYVVLSGSMEPVYPTGSLIYVRKVDCRDLKVGDPITFMLGPNLVATHRIVKIIPDPAKPADIRYQTKGDANNSPDGGLVHCKNVIGEPVFCIPGLGYIVNYVQRPPGLYLSIAAGMIVLFLIFLPDLRSKSEKKQGREEDDKDSSGR